MPLVLALAPGGRSRRDCASASRLHVAAGVDQHDLDLDVACLVMQVRDRPPPLSSLPIYEAPYGRRRIEPLLATWHGSQNAGAILVP
jgi:hypothetical protein